MKLEPPARRAGGAASAHVPVRPGGVRRRQLVAQGEGVVLVVLDGKVHRQAVQVGKDDGMRAEVLSGLDPKTQVILKPDTSIAEHSRATPL